MAFVPKDPNLEDEFDPFDLLHGNATLKQTNWDPDYFTRALPFQQRGTAPAIPVTGLSSADWPASSIDVAGGTNAGGWNTLAGSDPILHLPNSTGESNAEAFFGSNTVDLASATTINISDLRWATQLQRWLERNARGGYRYNEFIKAHFGEDAGDDRLLRPEYIGGIRQPIIISEVLQTSETGTTPQGTLAGHGIMAGSHYVGKYHVKEYGLIMCIMSVQPRPAYQQGINRQWLRQTHYDFYHPEFANLSEQAIYRMELYANTVKNDNLTVFGYQGRYDEMRVKKNQACAQMRDTLDYWHLGRQFGSAPSLNQTFIECIPDKRIFAVQDEDGLIVNIANVIKAIRPIPVQSNPGLIDHD